MEWLDTIIGAVVGGVAYWAGTRRPSKKLGRSDPQPLCGCEHHFSMHDPETKRCHAHLGWHWQDGTRVEDYCQCRTYTGPEPLPEYYA